MVFDAALLNTQHYKVRIKGKMEQSGGWSSAPLELGVVAIEKGAFGSLPTKFANFIIIIIIEFSALLSISPYASVAISQDLA